MEARENVRLSRDCEAILIPSGEKTTLKSGNWVTITQSLGGSYTVMTDEGYLARISDQDADALGKTKRVGAHEGLNEALLSQEEVEKLVWEQLKTCFDPEIPVNIVDLGLIYLCELTPLANGGFKADIRMTLTAPGCGMGPVLKNDVETKVRALPGIKEIDVELVFDPTWNQSMMSEAARLQLGFM